MFTEVKPYVKPGGCAGFDAIITAAGEDMDKTPESVVFPVHQPTFSQSSSKQSSDMVISSTPISTIMKNPLPTPDNANSILKLEVSLFAIYTILSINPQQSILVPSQIQASLMRSQSQAANGGNDKSVANCNCKKSKCLKMCVLLS
jgi:hypothetical protein